MTNPILSEHRLSVLQNIFLYGLVTLLLWEWLRPLPLITDTHTVQPMLQFTIFVMLLTALRIQWMVRYSLLIIIMFYILHAQFFQIPFFDPAWISYLREDASYSLSLVREGIWYGHSSFIRSLVFMVFIWILTIFLYTNIIRKNKIPVFFVVTIFYLAFLDTFAPYDASLPIVRTMIVGFFLLALLHLNKVRTSVIFSEQRLPFPKAWLVASLVMIVAITAIGFLGPKAPPSWPDPVKFMKSYSTSTGSGLGLSPRKSGYGDQDHYLGGPFIQDETPAFMATSTERHYWRGESKDFYTGHGWEDHTESYQLLTVSDLYEASQQEQLEEPLVQLYYPAVDQEVFQSRVFLEDQNHSIIFLPGNMYRLSMQPAHSSIRLDDLTGRVSIWEGEEMDQPGLVEEYQLQSSKPTFSIKALQESDINQVSEELLQRYTQLPETLPERVGELAQEITDHLDTTYDKVKEIEHFFRRYGYQYETRNVPMPSRNQDYVDQFIFETKRGYCDNFSSAMVVMLRSIDIPARWVKGFTSGEVISREEGQLTTMVRNKNAHSWVEVYFPEIGWVPFEPTRTFANPYPFERDHIEEVEQPSLSTEESVQANEYEVPELPVEQRSIDVAAYAQPHQMMQSLEKMWQGLAMLFLLLVLTAVLLFAFQRKLILSWVILHYQRLYHKNQHRFLPAYETMITYLGKYMLKREPQQTIREYIVSLEPHLEAEQELIPLTKMFEAARYGENIKQPNFTSRSYQLWQTLMKKIRS